MQKGGLQKLICQNVCRRSDLALEFATNSGFGKWWGVTKVDTSKEFAIDIKGGTKDMYVYI